ncbi:MAG: hypothetical protein ACOH1N_08145 [Lutibacter sp.]
MKKITLTTAAILLFLNIFAQEEKPCLLIVRYSTEKSSICSPRAWKSEGVDDNQEYALKKKQFIEDHKKSNPSVEFVSAKECVIVYEYKKKTSGFTCQPIVHGIIKAATLEKCEEQLRTLIGKKSSEYATPPNIVFRWSGKGLATPQKKTITADYNGVSGKFILIKKPSGNDFFVAQLTNNTTDKMATVLIATDAGDLIEEELTPGSTLTKEYEIKKLEIQVLYRKLSESKPSYDIIQWMKDKVHDILEIKNGEIIKKQGKMGSAGVRG